MVRLKAGACKPDACKLEREAGRPRSTHRQAVWMARARS